MIIVLDNQGQQPHFLVNQFLDLSPMAAQLPAFTDGDPRSGLPGNFGRYVVESLIGRGAFGRVFRVYDPALDRFAAIKVIDRPVSTTEETTAWLTEGRSLAALDHSGIVPVYDVGISEEGFPYLVSKLIEGDTLGEAMGRRPIGATQVAETIAQVADILAVVHRAGFVHRDIKPGNIILSGKGEPVLIDFGIALPREDAGTRSGIVAGTPEYMSPEQSRGESHLVDGRSDLFSLGVVLRELVMLLGGNAGRRKTSWTGLLKIAEHACELRAADRYQSADAMADALRDHVKIGDLEEHRRKQFDQAVLEPRGLRCFDERDSAFFPTLLPGPLNHEGLPKGIASWLRRLHPNSPKPFRVGVIFGRSGSGKSSLLRAGILPRLPLGSRLVYVEAAATDTGKKVRSAVRKAFPSLTSKDALDGMLRSLRLGDVLPKGERVLLVIDQFEQWLHEDASFPGDGELMAALRQCDGDRLQCLLVVRDDFWGQVSRLFQALEITLVDGENLAQIDAFDREHTRALLLRYGESYGATPKQDFLDRVLTDISDENDTVVPVRLSLFVEIFRSRGWNLQEFKNVGGIAGIGQTFLRESFGDRSHCPQARRYRTEAQRVLEELLPERGRAIRGPHVATADLRKASGCRDEESFADLLHVLDSELRLITPAEADEAAGPGGYRLAHDYLVPTVRRWLDDTRLATPRGRALIRLAELSTLWKSDRERRYLPSLSEWLSILVRTRGHPRTQVQRQFLVAASRWHGLRAAAVGACLAALTTGAWMADRALAREHLADRLEEARTSEVPALIESIEERGYGEDLFSRFERAPTGSRSKLNLALALAPKLPPARELLLRHLPVSSPNEFSAIMGSLVRMDAAEDVWEILDEGAVNDRESALRVTAYLAGLDPEDDRWSAHAKDTAFWITSSRDPDLSFWARQLDPASDVLAPLLEQSLQSGQAGTRHNAAVGLREWAGKNPDRLLQLSLLAEPEEIPLFAFRVPGSEDAWSPGVLLNSEQRSSPNALLFFANLGRGAAILPHLERSQDNGLRSQFAVGCPRARVAPMFLLEQLDAANSPGQQFAVLLALGHLRLEVFTERLLDEANKKVTTLGNTSRDCGIRSVCEWVQRTWGIDPTLALSPPESAGWWSNSLGQRFSLIQSEEGKTVAMATTELKARHFREFRSSYRPDTSVDGGPEGPVNWLDLSQARHFCNWLSLREGIPQSELCYVEVAKGKATYLWPVAGFTTKLGYRLPTTTEWRLACRAGTTTERYFGDAPELVSHFAWFGGNADRAHPVALFPPNDLGLFDMLGNLMEMCEWDSAGDDQPDGKPRRPVPLLGGSFRTAGTDLRASRKSLDVVPTIRIPFATFRLARTMPNR